MSEPAEGNAYQIVPVTAETMQAFVDVDTLAFFFEEAEPADAIRSMLDVDRCFAITPTGGPPFAGVYSTFDLRLGIPLPGGRIGPVPIDGLTWVGIDPDQRRRGLLTQMIRHQLDRAHDAGIALAGLHASEPTIYGRFGYAVATLEASLSTARGASLTAPDAVVASADTVTTASVWHADEGVGQRLARLQERVSGHRLGGVVRPERMSIGITRDFPAGRRGSEPERVLFAQRDGVDVGYAGFQRSSKWEGGKPEGSLRCWEMEAADSGALFALARRLLDMDLVSEVTLSGRWLDDPLVWWLGGPRGVKIDVYDAGWLRLVDVGAAMAQRGYATPVDVVLDVVDPFCPWNEGRWRLACTDSAAPATCVRTEDAADLRLPVQALGSAYLGQRSPAAQQEQGIVEELTAGAVARLTLAMATPTLPAAGVAY